MIGAAFGGSLVGVGLDFPVPSFCGPREPGPGDPHNCVAISDDAYEGWEIPEGSLLHVSPDGRLLSVVLAKETEWMGIPFAPYQPVEFIAGEPQRGYLARDVELDGIPLQGGTPVSVTRVKDALFVHAGTLSRDHRMEGRPGRLCAQGTPFIRGPGRHLASFHPAEPLEIGGLLLQPLAEVRLEDTRQGPRLRQGTLARAAVISGIPCAAGHVIELDPEGRLSRATLSEDWRGSTARWARGTELHLLATGAVLLGTLAEPAILGGLACAAAPVRFDGRGSPIELVLAAAQVVDGYPCRAGSRVRRRIDPHYELGAPYKSHGASFDVGDVVTTQRYRDGAPWPTVRLGAPRTIHGIALPSGSRVQLVGTLLRTLLLEPSSAIHVAEQEIAGGSEVHLDLFGLVKEVLPPSKRPAGYRAPAG